jgi:cellulose synthase/poly-beta-1,6-N-acetylglucosamine synthase-like glycosyltransferase
MCFTRALLQRVPYDSFSLVEDVEYGLRLGAHGVRVVYAEEAHVWGEMVSGGEGARSQRQRWEGGRFELARERALPLLREGIAKRSLLQTDLAIDLLIPPLAQLFLWLFVGALLSAGLLFVTHRAQLALAVDGAGLLCLSIYLCRGLMLSGAGLRGILDLTFAPLYIVWKLFVSVRGAARKGWVRTAREGGSP